MIRKPRIKRLLNKYKKQKEKEFTDKYAEEEKLIEDQINDLLNNNTVFDAYNLKKMPDDYVQFVFTVILNKMVLILLDEDSRPTKEHALAKLKQNRIMATVKIGQDFQDIK